MHPSLPRFLLDKVAIGLLSISTGKILLSVCMRVCMCQPSCRKTEASHGKEHTK